jgi:predicted small metal-binding protein
MGRKVADCREEDEVVAAATQHAVSAHGHEDTTEVQDWLRQNLKDEVLA